MTDDHTEVPNWGKVSNETTDALAAIRGTPNIVGSGAEPLTQSASAVAISSHCVSLKGI